MALASCLFSLFKKQDASSRLWASVDEGLRVERCIAATVAAQLPFAWREVERARIVGAVEEHQHCCGIGLLGTVGRRWGEKHAQYPRRGMPIVLAHFPAIRVPPAYVALPGDIGIAAQPAIAPKLSEALAESRIEREAARKVNVSR